MPVFKRMNQAVNREVVGKAGVYRGECRCLNQTLAAALTVRRSFSALRAGVRGQFGQVAEAAWAKQGWAAIGGT